MKRIASVVLAACAAAPGFAETNVGVSVGINQPGVYGRIDIGNFPPPAVIHAQPVIIAPAPVVVQQRPVYLYVPPGHQKNWSKHCGSYGACGQPVYFVQESWVRARYEEHHAHGGGGNGKGKKHKGKHGDD
jgi:hypothetical protein